MICEYAVEPIWCISVCARSGLRKGFQSNAAQQLRKVRLTYCPEGQKANVLGQPWDPHTLQNSPKLFQHNKHDLYTSSKIMV